MFSFMKKKKIKTLPLKENKEKKMRKKTIKTKTLFNSPRIIILIFSLLDFSCSSQKGNSEKNAITEKMPISLTITYPEDKNGNQILDELKNFLSSSHVSIDCSISRLTDENISKLLIDKKEEGIPIRIALSSSRLCEDKGFLQLQYIHEKEMDLISDEDMKKHCQKEISNSVLDELQIHSFSIWNGISSSEDISDTNAILIPKYNKGIFNENFCIIDGKHTLFFSGGMDSDLHNLRTQILLTVKDNPDFAEKIREEIDHFSNGLFGELKPGPSETLGEENNGISFTIFRGASEKPISIINRYLRKAKENVFFFSSRFHNTKSSFSDPENLAVSFLSLYDLGLNTEIILDRGISNDPENATHYMISQNESIKDSIYLFPSDEKISSSLSHYLPIRTDEENADLQIFIIDYGKPDEKILFYLGNLTPSAETIDDSILILMDGDKIDQITENILKKFRQSSMPLEETDYNSSIEKGNIIITEYMANPKSIPDSSGEYVEIYNATDKEINLKGYSIETENSSGTMQSGTIAPHSYQILCASFDSLENGGLMNCIEIDRLPSITNSEGIIRIKNAFGQTEDFVSYLSTQEGISKELSATSLDVETNNDPNFWGSGSYIYTQDNMGSPGMQNYFTIEFKILNLFTMNANHVKIIFSLRPDPKESTNQENYCITSSKVNNFSECSLSSNQISIHSIAEEEDYTLSISTSKQNPSENYTLWTQNLHCISDGSNLKNEAVSFLGYEHPIDLGEYSISLTHNSGPDYKTFSLSDYDPYGYGKGKYKRNSYILISRSVDTFDDWNQFMIPDFSSAKSKVFLIDSSTAFNGSGGDNLVLMRNQEKIEESPMDSSNILLQKNLSESWNYIENIEENSLYIPLFEADQIFLSSDKKILIWAYGEDDVTGLFTEYSANFYLLYIPDIPENIEF